MTTPIVLSPSQTIGPLYGFALMFEGSENAVEPDSAGSIVVRGRIYDGAGEMVAYPEAMLELWRGSLFARTRTGRDGEFRAVITKPPASDLGDGKIAAPYLNVTVFARGLMKQAETRMYFPDEEAANAADPTLNLVDPARRPTLIAKAEGDELVFDIRLQGDGETVFFEF
jgi:protocatechuate 3,4-dioxygenase alpha subunit